MNSDCLLCGSSLHRSRDVKVTFDANLLFFGFIKSEQRWICCQLLSVVVSCCQLLSVVVSCCQLLSAVVSCCQLLSVVVSCCQLLSVVFRNGNCNLNDKDLLPLLPN